MIEDGVERVIKNRTYIRVFWTFREIRKALMANTDKLFVFPINV